jgi:hypothetical protein
VSKTYFAADGSFGNADLIVVDTSNWGTEEWDIIDNTPDAERMSVAFQLSVDADSREVPAGQDPLPGFQS